MLNRIDESSGQNNPAFVFIIILLSLAGLIGSLYLLDKQLRPYEGQRLYSVVVPPSQDSIVYFVDSARVAGRSAVDSLWAASKADSVIRADSASWLSSGKDSARIKRIKNRQITLNHNPSLLVWMITMAMTAATAFGLALPLVVQNIKLIRMYRPRAMLIIGIALLSVVIGIGLASGSSPQSKAGPLLSAFEIVSKFHVLLEDSSIMSTIVNITISVGVMAIFGMFLISICIPRLKAISEDPEELARLFHLLNNAMRFFLTAISVLILYSVVTTALVQQALEGVIKVRQFSLFPSEFIYSYGLVFTIFLAIIYLPVHYQLRLEADRIANRLAVEYKGDADNETLKKFDLHEPTMKSIQVFLSILAPILGSVFTELLKNVSQ